MKYKPQRSDVKTRELPPKVEQTKKGVIILCPFCFPPHQILPGAESQCGTTLQVIAAQKYLTSHVTKNKKIHCLKCGEIGGEMVRYRAGFVHMADCKPGTRLMTEAPKLSRFAKLVYRLPPKLRARVEKRTGAVQELQEIDHEGKTTGVVLGHFFWKG